MLNSFFEVSFFKFSPLWGGETGWEGGGEGRGAGVSGQSGPSIERCNLLPGISRSDSRLGLCL